MARYFIGQPSEDGEWEVGDRQLDNDQVAQCDSEDKAMRVARALSALDGKDDAAGRQHEIDMLREALAQSRHELADVESRNAELEEQLAAKGKKTLGSITDACDEAAANAKIAASQQAERIRACIAVLDEHAEHSHLFADRVQLCASKSPDDLRNLITALVAEHERREAARLEAEQRRAEIDEQKRAEFERQQNDAAKAAEAKELDTALAPAVASLAKHASAAADRPCARIKIGEINAAIAPLSITAEGLAQLGFNPVAQERAAKLYDASRLTEMLNAMASFLNRTAREQRWAA